MLMELESLRIAWHTSVVAPCWDACLDAYYFARYLARNVKLLHAREFPVVIQSQ